MTEALSALGLPSFYIERLKKHWQPERVAERLKAAQKLLNLPQLGCVVGIRFVKNIVEGDTTYATYKVTARTKDKTVIVDVDKVRTECTIELERANKDRPINMVVEGMKPILPPNTIKAQWNGSSWKVAYEGCDAVTLMEAQRETDVLQPDSFSICYYGP
ncbi:Hypothetical protein POVN_LOCUS463 [uncultured virus]|nr:Hypothetical protein POVN_LOCUS463 [uncultured virus]